MIKEFVNNVNENVNSQEYSNTNMNSSTYTNAYNNVNVVRGNYNTYKMVISILMIIIGICLVSAGA